MRDDLSQPSSVHQIVDKNGKPCKATLTKAIWVSYDKQEFGEHTEGNAATPFTTGAAYYEALITAIDNAQEEILIAGWQVNWDAILKPGLRLFDVLLRALKSKPKLKVFVMPWDDSAPVQTFDDQTKSVLLLINSIIDRKAVSVYLAKSLADESRSFFSHHQKQVVVDRKIAFVGGIDLAYGRFDDATYDLHADAHQRQVLNRYNGCIAQVGKVKEEDVVYPDLLTGAVDRFGIFHDSNRTVTREKILAGKWQTQYGDDSPVRQEGSVSVWPVYLTIDPTMQPRMPWQDVHCRIEGPAVSDLASNFIGRWNAQSDGPKLKQAAPSTQYSKPGTCQIQVLRSASSGLRTAEKKASANQEMGTAKQDDILRAMKTLILKAEHFIYIENQFFVSDFGASSFQESAPLSAVAKKASAKKWNELDQTTGAWLSTTRMAGDHTTSGALPRNAICAAIAQRIDTAIKDRGQHPFHVIITLPVHPEGPLNNGSIMTQIHWTMQTLVHGSHSLLNSIRRSIKAQQLRDKKEKNVERIFHQDNNEYQDIPVEDCYKYVTLLNLRNWEKLGNRYVTEQIYVHSKLMIVDDRYAILGSANINDRSLLGSRDTELAVMIVDDKVERKDTCGNGKAIPVRGFAHQLRRDVWKKIFGITGGVRPATELQTAIDHPASPKSWKAIQKVAHANTALYEAAFNYIPRNKDPNDADIDPRKKRSASVWPVWDKSTPSDNTEYNPRGLMPFSEQFWKKPQHNPAGVAKLGHIKGFITALPIEWTRGENNNMGYHTSLVADNDSHKKPTSGYQDGTVVISKDDNSNSSNNSGAEG